MLITPTIQAETLVTGQKSQAQQARTRLACAHFSKAVDVTWHLLHVVPVNASCLQTTKHTFIPTAAARMIWADGCGTENYARPYGHSSLSRPTC